MIRILLVDDQKSVRESLKYLLEEIPDFSVVGAAENGQAAIAQVGKLHPDIILLDMEMPGIDGVTTTRLILQQFPPVRVIMLSMHDSDAYVSQAVWAGAMGYLVKGTPTHELEEAIRSVHRGYAQIGPGLLHKIINVTPEPVTINSQQDRAVDGLSNNSKAKASGLKLLESISDNSLKKKRKLYLAIWLVGNILLWSTSLLYLKFKSPAYASSWTISLPGTASSTSINLPEIGQASSQNQSPFSNLAADPRENYKLLANSEDVVKPAAASLSMTPQEFGKPTVKILDNTTSMELNMEGSTPKESQAKAIAVHKALKDHLDKLKNIQSTEPDKNILKTIEAAQSRLQKARQELADFKASSGLNSNAQLENLANNLEQMRIEQTQLSTQQQRLQGKYSQLLQELKIPPELASDALALNSDGLFGQYLDNYSQIKTELVNLEAKYLPSHPDLASKQSDSQAAEAALLQRASAILGRSIDINTFAQLGLNSGGSREGSQKDTLLAELIDLQGEKRGLESQAEELKQQTARLVTEQNQRSRSGSELNRLKKNEQIAETVYSSILTQLEIDRANTSNIYPPISLLTQPSLPTEASSPKAVLVLLGSTVGSFFLTTALLSLYWRDRRDRQMVYINNGGSNNNKALANSRKSFELNLRP